MNKQIQARFERALKTALNFKGMSAGSPKVMLEISDVQYLLKWLEANQQPDNSDTALAWLQKVYAMGTSPESVVPQQNAGEMLARLDELGFGKQEPRRGNTLWAMVMDCADEIERLRQMTTHEIGCDCKCESNEQ